MTLVIIIDCTLISIFLINVRIISALGILESQTIFSMNRYVFRKEPFNSTASKNACWIAIARGTSIVNIFAIAHRCWRRIIALLRPRYAYCGAKPKKYWSMIAWCGICEILKRHWDGITIVVIIALVETRCWFRSKSAQDSAENCTPEVSWVWLSVSYDSSSHW